MFKIGYKAFSLLVLCTLFAHAEQESDYVIVWDVGYVLAQVDQTSLILKDLGIAHMLKTVWYGPRSRTATRALMYEALEHNQDPQPENIPDKLPVDDENGKMLPLFMADTWLCSRIPNTEILNHVDIAVNRWAADKQIPDGRRDLIKKTILTTLSARILGKNTKYIPAALKIVKEFAEQHIPQYILSNFEQEAFDEMLKNPCNQELFGYIPTEHMTVSGDCHMAKPHHCIFEYFVEHHKLHGKKIIFIDDQIRNIEAARACGWTAIHLTNKDYAQLAKDLNHTLEPLQRTAVYA